MLIEKLNLKTGFYCLNIIVFVMFYIRIDIQLIDVLYLIFIMFSTLKNVYFEVVR